jgi:hypothetical protein
VAEPTASLAAEAGTAVFRVAFGRWIAEDEPRELAEILRASLAELTTLTAASQRP